jgi:hypothetical protein
LHGPEGSGNNGIHRSKNLAQAGQNEAIRIGQARGYKLEEIDHLPPETIARAAKGELAALLRPAYLGNGRKPVIRASMKGRP